jgi:Outer membrane lipoprotein carrier protein LolA
MSITTKTAVIFLLCIFFCNRAFAEAEPNHDKITQLTTKMRQMSVIKGNFQQQKKLQGLQYSLNSEGEFIFWQNYGLYLATEKPFFNAFTVTPSDIIYWQQEGKARVERAESSLIQQEINKTLLSFFAADLSKIQEQFDMVWNFKADSWQLDLTPKMAVIARSLLSVKLEGDEFLQKIMISSANGDETQIIFSSQQALSVPSQQECQQFFIQAQSSCDKILVKN